MERLRINASRLDIRIYDAEHYKGLDSEQRLHAIWALRMQNGKLKSIIRRLSTEILFLKRSRGDRIPSEVLADSSRSSPGCNLRGPESLSSFKQDGVGVE
jgi:hypothetical protein